MKRKLVLIRAAKSAGWVMLVVVGFCLTVLMNSCNKPLEPNETLHKWSVAWPFFDVEKKEGVKPENNTTWKWERGDAVFWLSTWEKREEFDAKGYRIYRKERSTFIPFYSTEIEVSDQIDSKKGSILFFPYESQQRKK